VAKVKLLARSFLDCRIAQSVDGLLSNREALLLCRIAQSVDGLLSDLMRSGASDLLADY
jgi:hypothetical protein